MCYSKSLLVVVFMLLLSQVTEVKTSEEQDVKKILQAMMNHLKPFIKVVRNLETLSTWLSIRDLI